MNKLLKESAANRMDKKDFDRADLREALHYCPVYRWDALQTSLAAREWDETGKLLENILYEFLAEKENESIDPDDGRTRMDDILDDPRHGQAKHINRGK